VQVSGSGDRRFESYRPAKTPSTNEPGRHRADKAFLCPPTPRCRPSIAEDSAKAGFHVRRRSWQPDPSIDGEVRDAGLTMWP